MAHNEGTSTLRAAEGTSTGMVFISRLAPNTTKVDIVNHLKARKIDVINCEQIEKTRHSSYASFWVEVSMRVFRRVKSPRMWPDGIYTRKYFPEKDSTHNGAQNTVS